MNDQDQRKSKVSRVRDYRDVLQNQGVEGGKLPPQAVDLEEFVLGAMMLDTVAVNNVIDILHEESFYKESHRKIFAAIAELFQKGEPVDLATVRAQLSKSGTLDFVGGPYYISMLTDRVTSSANAQAYARIISEKYIQRELIRISNIIIKDAFEETTDVFDLLDKAESELFKVAEGNIRKNYDSMSSLIHGAMGNIENARKNKDGISGVPTGFTDLDRVTSGWQRSDMIVLAARPGMGKTAFVLSMARNVAVDFGIPVAVFSLEMSSVQLVQRLIASEAQISADKLRKGNLADHEYAQLHKRIAKLSDAPIFIDDTPALSIFELRAKCRRLKMQHGIQMIVIDYLQLMSAGGDSKGGNREQEISTISRSIKSIAKELDVPIIALSQLSRSVETRGGDKRPILSDLRESGAIEQDADIVCFIYRPEYYGIDTDQDGNPTAGTGEIIVAKHRNGALENVQLRFIGKYARFDNLDSFSYGSEFGGGQLSPSSEFDVPQTMTMPSKMNDMADDDDFGSSGEEEAPF